MRSSICAQLAGFCGVPQKLDAVLRDIYRSSAGPEDCTSAMDPGGAFGQEWCYVEVGRWMCSMSLDFVGHGSGAGGE